MSDTAGGRYPSHPPIPPQVPQTSPRRTMLMSPAMVVIGGLLAFFTVVFSVVILPIETYKPPASDNWLPITDKAHDGRAVFLANGCVYCHSGFSRPQDVYEALYYTYPRASEPGDFHSVAESPNVLGTARTGPDLSQEGGQHPDTWHLSHYDNPRSTTPLSIMPRFNFLSKDELDALIAYNQSRGGKDGTLRNAAIRVGNQLMRLNMSMKVEPDKPITAMIDRLKASGAYHEGGKPSDKSPSGLPWMAVWMINSFERGYWMMKDPLDVTKQNLIRGKSIYLQRCSGCHGAKGNGAGPGADDLTISPFVFNQDLTKKPMTSSGMFYHRILTGGPGTAMENFGTRLSVEDIWRVVLFLRTIPNGGLEEDLPTVAMYEPWTPPPPLKNYVETHPIGDQVTDKVDPTDPFMMAARWIAPGMTSSDEILIGGAIPMTLDRLSRLVRADYMKMIDDAYADAKARGEDLPKLASLHSTKGLVFHAP
ncbi:cbb3-type cytochrome c oxidase subunit II [Roseibium aggregatum]|uniref:C-type cytochrome n=1 Tax=Roseibium aggregatum TaxID=187304 RepID=A0A926P043_9HYPH|nr:cbb3-type cytochrome c oxidase subunit II [Roseibium aggregatum]MBD1549604.1 c-type cytochrome [Roseibium aggregatum]